MALPARDTRSLTPTPTPATTRYACWWTASTMFPRRRAFTLRSPAPSVRCFRRPPRADFLSKNRSDYVNGAMLSSSPAFPRQAPIFGRNLMLTRASPRTPAKPLPGSCEKLPRITEASGFFLLGLRVSHQKQLHIFVHFRKERLETPLYAVVT